MRLLGGKAMLQLNVFALDIAEIAEGFPQNAQVDVFLLGAAGVPKHANNGNFFADCCARAPSGHAAAPPSAAINFRLPIIAILTSPQIGGHAPWNVGKIARL